jgi:hypothetical protein
LLGFIIGIWVDGFDKLSHLRWQPDSEYICYHLV